MEATETSAAPAVAAGRYDLVSKETSALWVLHAAAMSTQTSPITRDGER